MIRWAIAFVFIAFIAMLLGWGGIAGISMTVAWWLVGGAILLAIIFALVGRTGDGVPRDPLI